MTDTNADDFRRASPLDDTLPGSNVRTIKNNAEAPPPWFEAWIAAEFKPFREEVRGKLKIVQVAKYVGIGLGTVLVARFPDLASVVQPILSALLGGG